jgi:hypothetical protein
MGACMSSPSSGIEVSEEDKRLHREAEKALKEVCGSLSLLLLLQLTSLFPCSLGEIEFGFTGQGAAQSPSWLIPDLTHVGLSGVASGVRRLWQVDSTQGTCISLHEWHTHNTLLNLMGGGSIQQMRLIHKVPFSSQEIENYRQLVFNNLTFGLRYVLEAMEDMELEVADDNVKHLEMIAEVTDLSDGEPFPADFLEPLNALWADLNVQKACSRGNEAALPEK